MVTRWEEEVRNFKQRRNSRTSECAQGVSYRCQADAVGPLQTRCKSRGRANGSAVQADLVLRLREGEDGVGKEHS